MIDCMRYEWCELCCACMGTGLESQSHWEYTALFPSTTFPYNMSIKVSWVTPNQYLEHTETQIDVDLWFFFTPHITLSACHPSLMLVDMDFLWKAPSWLTLASHGPSINAAVGYIYIRNNAKTCMCMYINLQRHLQWLIFPIVAPR